MKTQCRGWAVLVPVLFVAHAATAGGLAYVDSSLGLQTPVMEGGRTELEFGDVNGDRHPDIVCIGDHGSPYINSGQHGVMVWFGDGGGQWSVFQYGDFGYGGVALGDVNNDGLMDVGYGMHHDYASGDFGDQLLEVALGDGTGMSWTPWDDGLATNGETWGMFGTDFADVDNDGDLDVGSISFGCCAGIHVYLNNGDGTWIQSFGFVGGNSDMVFVFGDVNGDGLADIAASHGDGTVYVGDGQGGFNLADDNLPGSSWRRGVSLGDVTGDGRDEVCFVTSTGLGVWSRSEFGNWLDLSGSLATAGQFDLTEIVDMDLDGHGDIVAFRPDLVVVYGGDGTGGWRQIATISTPDACDHAALRAGTDVDHNGYPDIAIISEEDCQPFVGGTNRPRVYRESSTPVTPWVYPKYPRGGEVFIAGSVRF
ncbi:MAG: FG-GAP repeat domain-containing protein, partial [Planctomycetota bacterium]